MLKESPEYQAKVLGLLRDRWTTEDFDESFLRGVTFVYAIGTEREGDLLDLLPLFSKINLLKHLKIITRMDYKVQLAKIPLVDSIAPGGVGP